MALLDIIQTAAPELGIVAPGSAASNPDLEIQQMVAFCNRTGVELAKRHSWQSLTNEKLLTTLAAQDQGSILTICGTDFSFVVNETMWNRSQRRPVFGPKSPAQWQQLSAQFVQGPWQQYRIRGNHLWFIPAPPAGQDVYFEWISKNWATDSTGATGKQMMTADDDVGVLDENLLTLGVIWRFRKSKQMEYAEDFNIFEAAVQDSISRDASKPRLSLTGSDVNLYPAVIVPAGNWMTP